MRSPRWRVKSQPKPFSSFYLAPKEERPFNKWWSPLFLSTKNGTPDHCRLLGSCGNMKRQLVVALSEYSKWLSANNSIDTQCKKMTPDSVIQHLHISNVANAVAKLSAGYWH